MPNIIDYALAHVPRKQVEAAYNRANYLEDGRPHGSRASRLRSQARTSPAGPAGPREFGGQQATGCLGRSDHGGQEGA
jgi:hypothetical protein